MPMSTEITRQIVLDTETTGMTRGGTPHEGHCIIEIGAIEIVNRRLTGNNYHVYLKPDRLVDPEAFAVHGIADEFLLDKPTFAEICDDFIGYIHGTELVIHNASFDVGFIDQELRKLQRDIGSTSSFCKITDTLMLARRLFPGKRNSLDALCVRYAIDNSKRTLHGALLDAQILAEVYLAMTGGQTTLSFGTQSTASNQQDKQQKAEQALQAVNQIDPELATRLRVISASDQELLAHQQLLSSLKNPRWLQ